jgi:HSP20 family molecular chaperone IbpA
MARRAGEQDVWPQVAVQDKPTEYVLALKGRGLERSDVKVDVVGRRVDVRYDHDETIRQTAASGSAPTQQERAVHFSESLQLGRAVLPGRMTIEQRSDGLDIRLPKAPQSGTGA